MRPVTDMRDFLEDKLHRVRSWQATPEGQKEMARAEALERAKLRAQLTEIADRRNIPDDANTRNLAFDRNLSGPFPDHLKRQITRINERMLELNGNIPALLHLGGGRGLGKTVTLAWAVQQSEKSAYFIEASEIQRGGPWKDATERWNFLIHVRLLTIDEVGIGQQTEDFRALLLQRWNKGKITILAGNQKQGELQSFWLEERLKDRLNSQLGWGLVPSLCLNGESLRKLGND